MILNGCIVRGVAWNWGVLCAGWCLKGMCLGCCNLIGSFDSTLGLVLIAFIFRVSYYIEFRKKFKFIVFR